MKRLPIQSLCFLTAVLCIVGLNAAAKDPVSPRSSMLPAIHSATGSLTPPPKEWAMFPDESAPAAPPVASPAGQNAAPANATGSSSSSGAAVTGGGSMSNVVSASNARPVPHREFPLLWMLITGALSLGAVVACGSLIVSKDAPEESEESEEVAEIPVVSEFQEITE